MGGHAYGSIYPGPVGAVLMPALQGLHQWHDLPQASSLCGACREVCPVRIDIPRMLLEHRDKTTQARADADLGDVRAHGLPPGRDKAGALPPRTGAGQLGDATAGDRRVDPMAAGPHGALVEEARLSGVCAEDVPAAVEGAQAMSDSRDNVLAAVARGVRVGPLPPDARLEHPGAPPPLDRPSDREGMIASFTRELEKLMGIVHRVADDGAGAARVLGAARARGVGRVLAWDDQWLRPAGLGDGASRRRHRRRAVLAAAGWPRTHRATEGARRCGGRHHGRARALADTGSLVVVSGPGRGRIASLLPPVTSR